jgi:hypothetical protein
MEELYTTDLKYLIPLLGVLVGWILTSFGNYLKGLSDKQKILGKALMQLHFIYFEQEKVLSAFELLKDQVGVGAEYEKKRLWAMERYVLNNDNLKASVDIANELATVYPLTALKLKALIENYSFSQKMKLTSSSKLGGELYLKLLSMFEVAFELEHKELRKIIFKIAFGHGIFTWLQIRWKYYKADKNINKFKASEFLGIKEDLDNALQKHQEETQAKT